MAITKISFLRLIVFALLLFLPASVWSGADSYQRCLERLSTINNKVSAVSDRFRFYEGNRSNACLVPNSQLGAVAQFDGSLEECAHEIFAKRAQYRDMRNNLGYTMRSFCGRRPTTCPMPAVLATVAGTISTLAECETRLASARRHNENLQGMVAEAREVPPMVNEEAVRVCGAGRMSPLLNICAESGSLGPYYGIDVSELEMCLGDLRYETNFITEHRNRLECIHNSILAAFEVICNCAL